MVGIVAGFATVGSGIAVAVANEIEVGLGKIVASRSDDSHAVTTELITMRSTRVFATKGISPLNLLVECVSLSRLSVP